MQLVPSSHPRPPLGTSLPRIWGREGLRQRLGPHPQAAVPTRELAEAGREERTCSCHVYGSPGQPGCSGWRHSPRSRMLEHRTPRLGGPQATRDPGSQGGLTRSWDPV